MGKYRIQQLIGYTDGKPSWGTLPKGHYTRADAAKALQELRATYAKPPEFRIRKIKRRPR